ncbi:hypothetical protein Sango_1245800 [Sesamum angolense]|uniref:MULE transposase domain-containing protein n=1 Tax=Sesamum angolense TaxID=2727404 RepID=A0AAE1WQA4_9LAMI|nr:hypothetical protein Sango_1245800 [Sesamum angolense]
MYTKAGGQGSNICIYYSLPGQTLENGIQLLEGDKGITELLRDYKGLNVISLYIEENSGPIIAVDALGNVIENNVAIPQLMYDVEIEGVEVSETGAVDGVKLRCWGVGETGCWVSETEAAGFGETEGVGVSDGVVVSETDSDDSSEGDEEYVGDGQSGSSSDSDCPSWMLEDLEGPLDDDIFGSDDENVDNVVWNDAMDRQDVDLCIVMKTTTFQIKSIKGQHNCAHRIENKQANYKYIGKRIQDFVKDNPSEGLKSLKNKIRRDIQVDVSLFKVYRAKKYALELMKGDVKQQYARLYDYCATVCKHNSGSSMILKVDRCLNPPVLQRMYVCFGGLKEGFLDGCRPFIGLDGCFLKGMHKGQLLSAIGRDGNDNIYPIAMAYVEIEKHDSWEWFLNLLLRDIGSHDERGWAFISDRQKGLIEAVTQLAPRAEHRFCLRHMYNNFKGKFKGQELKNLFWKAASTYNVKEHLRIMKEIEKVDKKRGQEQTAIEWLAEIPSHHWARCFFPVKTHCDVVVNNMMAAIEYHRQNLEDFVHACFKKETYLRATIREAVQIPLTQTQDLDRHAQTSDDATPSSQEAAAEMHTQSSSSVPHYNATEESFPYAEMHTQSSSSVPLSNATAELHTNNPPSVPQPRFKNPATVPENRPPIMPQPRLKNPTSVSQVAGSSRFKRPQHVPTKTSRKQHAPISLSSRLEKRKGAESSSQVAFKRQCCPPTRSSISSVLKGVANSYKPRTQPSGSSSAGNTPEN